MDGTTLAPSRRPLTAAERQRLQDTLADLRAAPAAQRRRAWLAVGGVGLLLWVATIAASDAPWPIITTFWVVLGAVIGSWVQRDLRRGQDERTAAEAAIEHALARAEVDSYDIVAEEYVAFEEVDDEGACYAFALGDGRIVFIRGQQFSPDGRFPSLEFSIVYPLDESGRPVACWIDARGERRPSQRTVPAELKWELADGLPDHLEVVRAELDGLEEMLRHRAH